MVRGALILLLCLPGTVGLAHQLPVFPTTLTLTGRVVSAPDGTALRRARVDVAAEKLHLGSVLTDAAGRFAIDASGAGPFTVTISKGGYAFARTRLSRAEASVPMTVRLPRGAVIVGRVVDQQGGAAFSSIVSARRLDPEAAGFPQNFSTTTDDLGMFRLSGLPSGRFEISAGQPRSTSPIPVSVTTTLVGGRTGVTESTRVLNERLWGATAIDAGAAPVAITEARVMTADGRVQVVTSLGANAPGASAPPRQIVTVASGEEVNADFVVNYNPRADQELLEKLLAERGQSIKSLQEAPLPAGSAAGIRGRVTTSTGQPVSGAEVRLTGAAMGQSLSAGMGGQRVTTDADGRYLLRGLLPGSYGIQVSSAGSGTIAYGQRRAHQPGRTIVLATDQTLDGIDVVLPAAGTIAGVILDEDGEPIQGAGVQALQVQDADGRLVASSSSSPRRTDDRGRYRLFGLLPGTYVVAASVDVIAPGDALAPSGYAPIFFPGTAQVDNATRIDLDGDVSSVNLVFAPLRAAQVRGVALDSEGPLIGGTARILVSRRSGAISLDLPTAPLRGDGTFVFPNMPPGDYIVQVRGDGPGRTGMFGHEYVSVSDVDPAPLTIRTSRGATIEGRFVLEGQPESGPCVRTIGAGISLNGPCGGSPLSGFSVTPVALDADRARPDGGGSMVVSSESTFYVSGLFGPTAFRLRQAPSDSWFLKAVTIGGVDVTDTGFDPGPATQTTGDAEIVVSRNGATISGRVTDRDLPVAEYSVVVFPVFRDQWTPYSRRIKFAPSTTAGTFRAAGLPPGDYFVAAVDQLEGSSEAGEWQNPDVLGRLVPGAERITVREGETRVATLRLIRR